MIGVPELPEVAIAPRGEEALWFEYCNQRRLMYQTCTDCGAIVFYPRGVCPSCLSSSLAWAESSGAGTVFTYTIQHRAGPGYRAEVPYALAIIELVEGFRMMSRVLGDLERISVGAGVELDFASSGSQLVPVFHLVEGESQ